MNGQKTINGKHHWKPAAKTVLFGYEVIVVCEHENGEQRRKHHKRRTNKKWLKRYGVWSGQPLNKGQMIIADGALLVSRTMYLKIKQAVKSRSIDPTSMYLPCNPESDQSEWVERLKSFASPPPEKNRIKYIPFSEYSFPETGDSSNAPEDLLRFASQVEINRRVMMSKWFA